MIWNSAFVVSAANWHGELTYDLTVDVRAQDAELANAKLLAEKQTGELARQREEIRELQHQLDNSSSDADVVRQRDALLQRITVSDILLLCV